MKTVVDLVYAVHERATEMGMDMAPSDVGFILSLFFEGMKGAGETSMDEWLQRMADEVMTVKDET